MLLRCCLPENLNTDLAVIYLLKVNNRNTRTRCEIFSKLTINGVILVSLLLTLNIFHTFGVFNVNFKHVISGWGSIPYKSSNETDLLKWCKNLMFTYYDLVPRFCAKI